MRASGFVSLAALATVLAAPGCAAPETHGTRTTRVEVGGEPGQVGQITQAELQEELERFTSRLFERLTQAGDGLMSSAGPRVQQAVLRQLLRYGSSALDVVVGTYPEVNLLDMVVFMRLNIDVLEDYWIPNVYGPKGNDLLAAFKASEKELMKLALRVLSEAQIQQLHHLVDVWRSQNPNQTRVEWVRMSDFSSDVGRLAKQQAESSRGLLSGVRGAVVAADKGILLASRALFLSQRMPFLFRLQARLGSREIFGDSLQELSRAGDLLSGANPLIRDASTLAVQLNELVTRATPLLRDFKEHLPQDLARAESLTAGLITLTDRVSSISIEKLQGSAHVIRAEFRRELGLITLALIGVGLAWAVFGWGGYYLLKQRPRKDRHDRDLAA